jgi:hypothetical protein
VWLAGPMDGPAGFSLYAVGLCGESKALASGNLGRGSRGKRLEVSAFDSCVLRVAAMNALTSWTLLEEKKPPIGRYVLVWSSRRKLSFKAKWTGKYWNSVGNNTSAKDGTHWCFVIGPNGEDCESVVGAVFTRRDSQSA